MRSSRKYRTRAGALATDARCTSLWNLTLDRAIRYAAYVEIRSRFRSIIFRDRSVTMFSFNSWLFHWKKEPSATDIIGILTKRNIQILRYNYPYLKLHRFHRYFNPRRTFALGKWLDCISSFSHNLYPLLSYLIFFCLACAPKHRPSTP